MNFNDYDQYLPYLLETSIGLSFYINDFDNKGIIYLELGDYYNMKISKNIYKCLMLNDDISYNKGLTQIIYKNIWWYKTDYFKRDKKDIRISKEYIIINKQTQEIEALSSKVNTLRDTYA